VSSNQIIDRVSASNPEQAQMLNEVVERGEENEKVTNKTRDEDDELTKSKNKEKKNISREKKEILKQAVDQSAGAFDDFRFGRSFLGFRAGTRANSGWRGDRNHRAKQDATTTLVFLTKSQVETLVCAAAVLSYRNKKARTH
jgi:hypothetical protein